TASWGSTPRRTTRASSLAARTDGPAALPYAGRANPRLPFREAPFAAALRGDESDAPALRRYERRPLGGDDGRDPGRHGSVGPDPRPPPWRGQGAERVRPIPGPRPRSRLAQQARRARPLPPAGVRSGAADERPRAA